MNNKPHELVALIDMGLQFPIAPIRDGLPTGNG